MPFFDQFNQSLCKPGRGSAVDHVVVEHQCQVENLRASTFPSTIAGFQAMLPTTISKDWVGVYNPQPLCPLPNMPIDEMPTVPVISTMISGLRWTGAIDHPRCKRAPLLSSVSTNGYVYPSLNFSQAFK